MKTQLYIKEIINEPGELVNNTFTNGLTGWSGGTNAIVENNIVYLDAPSTGAAIYQSNIIQEVGHYKITITIAPPLNLSNELQGYVIVTIGNVEHIVNSLGTHTFYLSPTDVTTGNFILKPSGIYWGGPTLNGGIASVTIEGTSGEYKEVDLYEDVNIPITYNIADIKNFAQRRTTHSGTIKMPGTQNNNKIFKHIYDINTRDKIFILNKPVDCYILYDGISHFEGNFELLKIIDDNGIYYEGLVYTDFGLLFNNIQGYTLRGNSDSVNDLSFLEYYQKLSFENVNNSWDELTPKGSGVVYAPIDKNNKWDLDYDEDSRFSISELSPCLYIKEIWDKIFEKAGFTYNSDFINGDMFKSLVYPSTEYRQSDTDVLYEFEATQVNDPQSSGFSFDKNVDPYNHSDYNTIDWIDPIYDSNVTYSSGTYTVQESGEYRIKFKGNFKAFLYYPTIYGNGPVNAGPGIFINNLDMPFSSSIYMYINNNYEYIGGSGTYTHNDLQTEYYVLNTSTGKSSNLVEYAIDYDETIFLEEGEQITFQKNNVFWHHHSPNEPIDVYVFNDSLGPLDDDLTFCSQATNNVTVSIEKTEDVLEGSYYDPTQILHKDFKQTDFLMSIIKMFNLYAEPDGYKNFKIEPIKDFYTGESVDWTDKINKAKPITYERSTDIIESILSFKYTEGKDTFNQCYNNAKEYEWGSYHNIMPRNTDSENKLDVEINFAPTITGPVTKPDNTGLVSEIIVPKIFSMNNSGEIDMDKVYNPRILFWNGMKDIAPNIDGNTQNFQLKSSVYSPGYYSFYHRMPYFSTLNEPYGNATLDLLFASPAWHWEGSTWPTGTWTPYNSLYNLYYRDDINYRASEFTKLVTMKINLTKKDIDDLKFSKFIFIKDTYYRLNKLKNVVPNKEATIELINVIDSNVITDAPKPYFPIHIKPISLSTIHQLIKDRTNNGDQHIDVIDGISSIDDSVINIDIIDSENVDNNINSSSIYMPVTTKVKPRTKYKIDVINNVDGSSERTPAATLKDINKE